MTKLTIAIVLSCVLAVLLPGRAGAFEPLLCIAEKAIGFDWANGEWVQKTFKAGQKYIVNKRKLEDCYFRPYGPSGRDASRKSFGCYELKQIGEEPGPPFWCKEILNGEELFRLDCAENSRAFEAIIDGPFARTNVWSLFHPPPGYDWGEKKDSLFLEIGKCSSLKNL